MNWDDAVILFERLLAVPLFAAQILVIAWRLRAPTSVRIRRSRWALLALWCSLTFVSLYATGQRLMPDQFALWNDSVSWGPLAIATFNLIAAVLSAWAYLPWNRSTP